MGAAVRLRNYVAFLVFSLFFCLAVPIGALAADCASGEQRQELSAGLETLVEDMTEDLSGKGVKRIAVLDPEGPKPALSLFSSFLVDEVNRILAEQTSLSMTFSKKRVFDEVVERRKLWDIITQQKIEMSGHFDQASVTPLGKKVGVDALVFLKAISVGKELTVQGKIISVATGGILGGGTVDVERTAYVEKLLKTPLTSKLTIKVEPWLPSVKVSIDGEIKAYPKGGLRLVDFPQGLHKLRVMADCHNDYALNFYLASPREIPVYLEARQARLKVTAKPPQAKVMVDNRHVLELDNSGVGAISLPAGFHTVSAMAKDFPPYEKQIILGCVPKALNLDLTKPKIKLDIKMIPASAKLRLDDITLQLDGQGRWSGMVEQGKHKIVAQCRHHEEYVATHLIEKPKTLDIKMRPVLYPVDLEVRPVKAQLFVNGNNLATNSQGKAKAHLPAGVYEISARMDPGYEGVAKKVSISGPCAHKFCLKEKPLELQFAAVYERDGKVHDLKPGAVLYSDENYAIAVKPSSRAYVYLLQVDGAGNVTQLFPNPVISPLNNPLQPGKWHWIPPKTDWAYLDYTLGKERIYVLASHQKDMKLEKLARELALAVENQAMKRVSVSVARELATRGIAGVRPGRQSKIKKAGNSFLAAQTVIRNCGAAKVFMLEFLHK